uniref:Xylulose kinase-1 n=1 Tax=Tanacetum cinerariifolium TaxID=118510 RepID=A0A6L2J6S9_TANCI|nr:hypothetical protein [Tanacetum cinerariifolium]
MSTLKFAETYNMIVFLSKPTESEGFEQIIDFNANPIKYALTVNPTDYTSCIKQFWTTAKAKNINGEARIHAKVDGKKVFGNMRRVDKDFFGKIAPLFPTMMVQDQEEIGEGSANPTDPHHTPTIIQPSTSQPSRKHKSRKTKRKDTELPRTSVPTEHVADEAVNEEMDDSLERATTTATSLDLKQDRGNISKTQSKETPNEPSSPGTSLSGGPKHQDTMGDTITQIRSENVSKFSNDPLLVGVNTPRSGEDSLKLTELMELCTHLLQRVFDLETTKTSQAQEITSLKKKVGLSARVDSSVDEESLGEEDASKQGRISSIDANQDIYLINVYKDEDIFGVNDQDDISIFDANKHLQGEEVVIEKEVAGKDVSAVEEVNAASIATSITATTTIAATTPTISMNEITLAKALVTPPKWLAAEYESGGVLL